MPGPHDFRHPVSQTFRRQGTYPKVVAAVLGHSKVNLATEVYDHTERSDLEPALRNWCVGLVPDGTQAEAAS
jgi:site-specific recombinase XerD